MQVQQAWPQFASVMRDDAVEFRRVAAPARATEPPPPAKRAEAPQPALPEPEPPDLEDVELALQAELESELMSQPDVEPVLEPGPEPEIEAVAPAPAEGARQTMRQTISLKSHLTGLPQVIWLARANGRENVVIEVTPGGRYDRSTIEREAIARIVEEFNTDLINTL